MNRSRIVIAGTNSGAGKTTVTLGLMAAFKRRNLQVQGFKVGPDYIDPSYHAAVTGRSSRNLDTWMMSKDVVREVFHRGSEGADISVIEGVMGMYDGKVPLSNTGSTAEVSQLLQAPVLLVVNAESMARSAAAVVLGFQQLDPSVNIAGVIVNQVGSKGHFELVKAAIEQMCGVPTVGYLTRQSPIQIPERHLGLIPALERGEMTGLFDALADAIEATVDVEQILQIAGQAESWTSPEPVLFVGRKREPEVTLAVARDEAFNFYYPENLELLEWYGARLVEFKPLHGEVVPDGADGVYIGGGFPEEFADELSRFDAVRMSLRRAVQDGMPVFAECGGFMYLTDTLTDRQGETYQMAGLIPACVAMQSKRAALGYREITACQDSLLLCAGERARGHEFHYSTATYAQPDDWPYAYEAVGLRGTKLEGYAKRNLLAGYTHLHFASNPRMVERFIAACRLYKENQTQPSHG
ncbi:cobyrinate a,c-diamide synthase [Alicyclobacillus tolerans]|uniref:cobyrinate a,c-diamide synthase n=1 Tax=Alicyclobacillus tolerans TaxID=90970 RepID=UPI001F02965C|nr:cobyrinate a,c-diamide synthase [Alicyclobacillus tolerans]MCF8566646.1 cobyrinate a,c-diamide synthase [Alicyclobacillus tolerans]